MEKLFAALAEQHPGFSVVDVRFLADNSRADNQNPDELDQQFADAISGATDLDLTALS
jgi:hypothetical protein